MRTPDGVICPVKDGPDFSSVQLKFLKHLFGWLRNTPNYICRLETGRNPLSVKIIKELINFWSKLSLMSNEGLPNICFDKLISLDMDEPWTITGSPKIEH